MWGRSRSTQVRPSPSGPNRSAGLAGYAGWRRHTALRPLHAPPSSLRPPPSALRPPPSALCLLRPLPTAHPTVPPALLCCRLVRSTLHIELAMDLNTAMCRDTSLCQLRTRGKHGGMYVDEEAASSSPGPVSLWRGGAGGGGGGLWRSQFVSV